MLTRPHFERLKTSDFLGLLYGLTFPCRNESLRPSTLCSGMGVARIEASINRNAGR